MTEDFSFDVTSGRFIPDVSSGLLTNAVLLLSAKAKPLLQPHDEFCGDWFLSPSFGNNLYELKHVTPDVTLRLKNFIELALGKLSGNFSSTFNVYVDSIVNGTASVFINLFDNTGNQFEYQYFFEVR